MNVNLRDDLRNVKAGKGQRNQQISLRRRTHTCETRRAKGESIVYDNIIFLGIEIRGPKGEGRAAADDTHRRSKIEMGCRGPRQRLKSELG